MNYRLYIMAFWAILIIGIIIRMVPLFTNSFYFTIDQGDDLVHVRALVYGNPVTLKGPSTGIAGFYAGPLWYYALVPWYLATAGHPAAGIFFLIFLNALTCGMLMATVGRRLSRKAGLLVGIGLQLFWPFYDTSRYSFHPFTMVFISIAAILATIELEEGKKNRFYIIATLIGLVFHAEVAVAPVFIAFYLLLTLYFLSKRMINWLEVLNGFLITGLFLLPYFISEFTHGFAQTNAFYKGLFGGSGVFSDPRISFILQRFEARVTESVVPQNPLHVFLLLGGIIGLLAAKRYVTHRPTLDRFTKRFTVCSLLLLSLSWAWFSTNQGWQPWHTAYNPMLFFITVVLLMYNTPLKIRMVFLALLFISQVWLFQQNYRHYLQPFDDPSILANQLSVLDWVYQHAQGKGFYVYNYVPSVYDPQYQYLFWWYGRKHYGYMPCEYANSLLGIDSYVPHKRLFIDPQRECAPMRFLIIEPDKNQENQKQWIATLQKGTTLIEETTISTTRVQKLSLK